MRVLRIRAFQRRDFRHVIVRATGRVPHRFLTTQAYVTRVQCRPGVWNQPISSDRFPDCSYPSQVLQVPRTRAVPASGQSLVALLTVPFPPRPTSPAASSSAPKTFWGASRRATRDRDGLGGLSADAERVVVAPRARAFGCAIPRGALGGLARARPRDCRRTHKSVPPAIGKALTGRERGARARARAHLFPRINSTHRHHLPARYGAENLFFRCSHLSSIRESHFSSHRLTDVRISVSTSFVRCYGVARGVLVDGSGRGLPTRPFVR